MCCNTIEVTVFSAVLRIHLAARLENAEALKTILYDNGSVKVCSHNNIQNLKEKKIEDIIPKTRYTQKI